MRPTETLQPAAAARRTVRPTLAFAPELLLRAQPVRVAFFDVDGVLTDGGVYFAEYPGDDPRRGGAEAPGPSAASVPPAGADLQRGPADTLGSNADVASAGAAAGETLKRFSVLDGYGFKLLRRAGIVPVVITGRDSVPLRARLTALGVTDVHYGTEDKRPAAEATLAALGFDWSQAAAMGDDWPDLPLLTRAAFACAPANAHPEVRALADHVTAARGGNGAAREFCDLLAVASGRYAALLEESAR